MKKFLFLFPVFLLIFAVFCACRITKNSDAETDTTTGTGEVYTTEAETVNQKVLDRLLGKDTASSTAKNNGKSGSKTNKTTAKDKETVSDTKKAESKTTTKKASGNKLSEEELSAIKDIGINLDKVTEKKSSRATTKIPDNLDNVTTSKKEVETITSKVNSASGSGGSVAMPVQPAAQSDKNTIMSGKYAMNAVIRTNDGEPTSFKLYMDGDKYSISTDVDISDTDTVPVQVISDGTYVYLALPKLKAYVNGGRADSFSLKKDAFDNIIGPVTSAGESGTYVQTSVITVNDVSYDIEEYKTEDGKTVKFYCAGEQLKRIDITGEGGDTIIIEIISLSPNVPASAFKVPSGYTDMTKIINSEDLNSLIER